MFVKIYKTGYISHALSIIIIAIVIWLPAFFAQQTGIVNSSATSLLLFFNDFLEGNYFASIIISLIVVIVAGLVINNLISTNEISGKTSMLGFFFFVLVNASISSNIFVNQFLVASFFILMMVNTLFKIPKVEDTIPITFNASFFLGLASLFYAPSILLIFIIWVALMIFSVSTWRDYVVTLIGVLLPLFFTFFWYYFIDKQELFYSIFIDAFQFDFSIVPISNMDLTIAILLLGFVLFSVLKLSGSLMERSIVLRQKLSITIWLLVFSFLIIFLFHKHPANGILLSVPVTIILTNVLAGVSKLKWYDLYISLVFILILVNHYLVLF